MISWIKPDTLGRIDGNCNPTEVPQLSGRSVMPNTRSSSGWDRKTLIVLPTWAPQVRSPEVLMFWSWLIPLFILLTSVKERGRELRHLAVVGLFSWGFLCHPFDYWQKKNFLKDWFPTVLLKTSWGMMIMSMMFWSDDQTGPKSVPSCANGYVPKHYSASYLYFAGLKVSAICQYIKSVQVVENGIHFENCWPSAKCIGKTLVHTENAKGCVIFLC